jgi:hypothetical protein
MVRSLAVLSSRCARVIVGSQNGLEIRSERIGDRTVTWSARRGRRLT